MSISRLLRKATGAPEDRRRSPRKSCRLNCTMQRRRKRIPARVLDVSEGGLCLLSPVELQTKERIKLHIDVPPQGPVEVEVVAWHVRRVKSGRAGRKTWSIGMMIQSAGSGFRALLESGRQGLGSLPEESDAAAMLEELSLESEELSPEWDEWSSEWDQLFEESEKLLEASQDVLSQADLRVFRVRVKAIAGPRTRVLTLNATSAKEAADSALKELGDDWKILEVNAA